MKWLNFSTISNHLWLLLYPGVRRVVSIIAFNHSILAIPRVPSLIDLLIFRFMDRRVRFLLLEFHFRKCFLDFSSYRWPVPSLQGSSRADLRSTPLQSAHSHVVWSVTLLKRWSSQLAKYAWQFSSVINIVDTNDDVSSYVHSYNIAEMKIGQISNFFSWFWCQMKGSYLFRLSIQFQPNWISLNMLIS